MEQILEVEDGRIKAYELSDVGENVAAMLSLGRSHYDCGGWTVKIVKRQSKPYIVVQYYDSSLNKVGNLHGFKLRDGVLQIQDSLTGEANLVKFHTAQLNDSLEEKFGITKFVIGSPNFSHRYSWNPRGIATNRIDVTWLVTDGKHTIPGHPEKAEYVAELLKGACGGIQHCVNDATWTVVCSTSITVDDATREVTLYTEESNLFKVSRLLEKFLEESDYSRFEDIVEGFMEMD